MDFNLEEMFELRRAGWSYSALGRKYGKDHTTILFHCEKHNVAPEMPLQARIRPATASEVVEKIKLHQEPPKAVQKPKEDKYANILYPKTKPGRNYKSYLKKAMKDPVYQHYFQTERLVFPSL